MINKRCDIVLAITKYVLNHLSTLIEDSRNSSNLPFINIFSYLMINDIFKLVFGCEIQIYAKNQWWICWWHLSCVCYLLKISLCLNEFCTFSSSFMRIKQIIMKMVRLLLIWCVIPKLSSIYLSWDYHKGYIIHEIMFNIWYYYFWLNYSSDNIFECWLVC